MAIDKAVDSAQLDADLTTVANAIRTKGGTSADLAFPAGFVSAVQAIPSGGGGEWTSDGIAGNTEPSGDIVLGDSVTHIMPYAFAGKAITSIYGKNVSSLREYCFWGTTQLVMAKFPNATTTWGVSKAYQFQNSGVQEIYIPKFTQNIPSNFAQAAAQLRVVDVGMTPSINTRAFANASALSTIIIRKTNGICGLGSVDAIASSTPFKNGGAGGTVYIPQIIYDHLGTGDSLDYKAATNWSTINGYGTITWAVLEDSPYADPIT